jgi:hypothetical protein
MDFSVKSDGLFLKLLERRKAVWSGEGNFSYRLRVPPTLSWWYYQEFGTATKFQQPPTSVGGFKVAKLSGNKSGGNKYKIEAVNAKLLRFPYDGRMIYKLRVMHPGVEPARFVASSLTEIDAEVRRQVRNAFEYGAIDNPKILKGYVESAVVKAKDLIATNMSRTLNGTREVEAEGGKLGGRDAASVFDDQAEIVEG